MKRRLLAEEDGFTLPEVLVTMMLMIVVLFALYAVFDMSIRVFSFGNDKVEAVENARIGLARMEREIRAAYPYDKISAESPDETLIQNFGSNPSGEITFGNDLNGNRIIEECPTPDDTPCEEITYRVYETGAGPYALGRANSDSEIVEPVVEFVDYNGSADTGVEFSYLKWDAAAGDFVTAVNESEVELVRITLRVRVDDTTQTLSTDVALRNRNT